MIDSTLTTATYLGHLPAYMENARVSGESQDGSLAIGSGNPISAVRFYPDQTRFTSVSLPHHRWGREMATPLVPWNGDTTLATGFGDVDASQWIPVSHPDVPLVALYDRNGRELSAFGSVSAQPGRYLTWYEGLTVPGRVEGGVVVLKRDSARVARYDVVGGTLRPSLTVSLPGISNRHPRTKPSSINRGSMMVARYLRFAGPRA